MTRRILVLANKAHGLAPGQRFRFEQWAPRLERDHDIVLDLRPFESPALTQILYRPGQRATKAALVMRDFLRRFEAVRVARRYDAILIFREASLIGPALFERLLAWSRVPVIFDYDDSIWSSAQQMNNGIFSRLHFFGKTKTICRIATAVTAGNEFLAAYARRVNDQVFVVPTSIELDEYPVSPEAPSSGPFVICWTGSTSTLAHFEHAREALELLAQRRSIAVKVICNEPPRYPIAGAEMRFVPWSRKDEASEIGSSHVGIMPLPDDEATRGKCGLKALQCMATGRPVIVSPVGMNTELISDGDNGYLARTTQEWVSALERLADSADLRRQIGSAGRKTVEQRYSAEAVAAQFARIINCVTA